jgi:hypothetical protein
MSETNACIELLAGLLEKFQKGEHSVIYRNQCFPLNDPDLPIGAGVAFIRGQVNALSEAAKAAGDAAS